MKILHIAPDEKFIGSIQWQFERIFPDQNKYFIFLSNKEKKTKYVQEAKHIEFYRDDSSSGRNISKELYKYDLVILHGLKYFQSRIVLKAPADIKFVWFFWGGEIYDNPKALSINTLGQVTKKRFLVKRQKKFIKEAIRPIYYFLKFGTSIPEISILKAAKKIQYLGIIHREEVEYLKNNAFIGDFVKHVQMTYYPLEFIFKGIEGITVTGKNILLGNSASLTNNHLEAFDMLKNKDLTNRKLVVPLSYGNPEYATEICTIGEKTFGEAFMPLREFIPLKEYNTILSSCSVVIMNHFRQQAVGNILAMLWMGAKVYLNESNTFYHYLKRLGVEVYSIDKDFVLNDERVLEGLDSMQIENNRKLVVKAISFETTKDTLKRALLNISNAG